MPNVLLINGSPESRGCIARALKEVSDTLNKNGIDTKTVWIGKRNIRGCIGCRTCKKTGKCIFKDEVNETAPLFEEADGIVLGAPVYFGHANGQALSFCDRLFYSTLFPKNMKVGAAVVSSRRAGSTSAFEDLNKYFTISGMPVASSTYWNEVHGYTAEDVERDLEGLQTMRNLGNNMAFLVKAVALAKKEYGEPKLETQYHTNFFQD